MGRNNNQVFFEYFGDHIRKQDVMDANSGQEYTVMQFLHPGMN